MANKLKSTRIRLPPIDSSVHDLVTGFPLHRKDSEKGRNVLARQQNIPVDRPGFFPPLVQPSRQKLHSHDHGRKSLRHPQMKITHTEKIPTQFPGKKFAVLPPIGSSCRQERNVQQSDKNPSVQPGTDQKLAKQKVLKKTDSTEYKASNSEFTSTSIFNTPKRGIKKQMSVFGLANADRKQEYKVRNNSPEDPQIPPPSKAKDKPSSHSLTKAKSFVLNDDVGNDGDDNDDSTMMKLFEVLQFLEWSSELREFLNGRNSGRRNATCCSLDPMLSHTVDIIRDILLKQTMEELCMMW